MNALRPSRLVPILMFFIVSSALTGTEVKWERSPAAITVDRLMDKARDFLGVPYVLAGFSRSGIDCSGLTSAVYQEGAGLDLPRSTSYQIHYGQKVEGPLAPGDLLFFDTLGRGHVSHVGLYIGGRRMIHAASEGSRTGVIVSDIDEDYYTSRFLYARRLVQQGNNVLQINLTDQPLTWNLDRSLRSGTWFDLEMDVSALKSQGLKLVLRRDGREELTKIKRLGLSKGLDRFFLSRPGQWVVEIRKMNGKPLVAVNIKVT